MSKQWYVSRPGDPKRFGPYDDEKLKQLAQDGRLQPNDLVWQDGMADWVEAVDLGGLEFELPPPPPAYGYDAAPSYPQKSLSEAGTTKIIAGVCGIVFGYFGVHKFVIGATGPGLAMLLITLLTCGYGSLIMWPIGLIEGIVYLSKSDKDFEEMYIQGKKGWF